MSLVIWFVPMNMMCCLCSLVAITSIVCLTNFLGLKDKAFSYTLENEEKSLSANMYLLLLKLSTIWT